MQYENISPARIVNICIESDIKKLFTFLSDFLNQQIDHYDRFIFLYNVEDMDFQSKVNNRFLYRASELAIDQIFSFLCQSDKFKIEAKQENVTRIVQFQEYEGHVFQKVSLTYADAKAFFQGIDIDNKSNFLIFYRFDRMCYRTSTLTQLYSLIRELPSSCSYVFLSDNIYSHSFYEWVTQNLERRLVYEKTDKEEEKRNFTPKFIELNEIIRFSKESDLDANLSLIRKKLSALQTPLTELKYFFSDSATSTKEQCIKHYRNTSELKRYWGVFREFVLSLLLYTRLTSYHRNEKIVVISDSFNSMQWNDFLLDYDCTIDPQSSYPEFLRINEAKTAKSEFESADLIIVDIGDEITNDSQGKLIENFLVFSSIFNQILDVTEVLFIQPLLISEQFFTYLLSHPPCPYRLGYFYDLDEQKIELRTINLLLSGLHLKTKTDYYQWVINSWMIGTTTRQPDKKFSFLNENIQELRLTGLLKLNYYQTTALGKWFLHEELNISHFISYLRKENPLLFKTDSNKLKLSHITQDDIEGLFLSSIKWLFHTTKYRTLDSQYLDSFQLALIDAWHLHQQSTTFLLKANDFVLKLIQNEPEGSPKIHWNKKDTSEYHLFFPSKKPALPVRGRVLNQVLRDIEEWIGDFEDSTIKFPHEPFFDIRKYATETAREVRRKNRQHIPKSQYNKFIQAYTRAYFRAVSKLMNKQWTRVLTYLRYFNSNINPIQQKHIEKRVENIRTRLKVHHIRIYPQKTHKVLIFKENEFFPYHIPINSSFLIQTCDKCAYFKKELKKECIFFNLVALKKKNLIPDHLQERLDGIFAKKVACSMWRPKKPIRLRFPTTGQLLCIACGLPNNFPRREIPSSCSCQAEYRWISRNSAKKGYYRYHLSKNHKIAYDIQLLDPTTSVKGSFEQIKEDPLEPFHPSQRLDLHLDEVTPPRIDDETYVFIHETDIMHYRKDFNVFRLESPIKRKKGFFKKQQPNRSFDLNQVRVIDTCKLSNVLEEMLDVNPQIKINYRQYQLILKPKDQVSVKKQNIVPELKVHYDRKRKIYSYPLFQIASVFNIGKPRLTRHLDRWGVKVRYQPTKGVNKETADVIIEALELPGVRSVLRKMHLFGLILSNINATAQVIGLAETQNKLNLSNELEQKMKMTLFFRQKRWREFFRDFPRKSLMQINAIEGEIFRPFASGIRSFVEEVQNPLEPLIQKDYGRTVARRIKKKQQKDAYDSMGGYTPFDAANNCINRSLRTPLQLLNARTDIGFKTHHLFSHTSKDKPWKSGHLDLEEVGRIITRIFLAQKIVDGELTGNHFELRFDDDFTPYYVPYSWTWNMLRTQVVNRQIFPLDLSYQGQSLSYINAHKQHVNNLCSCLKTCVGISDFSERQSYLLEKYQPLIYTSKGQNAKTEEVLTDFLHIFMIPWIKKSGSPSDQHHALLKDIKRSLYRSRIVTDLLSAV